MDWNITVNLFETTTRRRFPALHGLVEDHYARCVAAVQRAPGDADFIVMRDRIVAARGAWLGAYTAWQVERGLYKGRTQRVRELLAELRGKRVALWDVRVSATDVDAGTWLPGSPGHVKLFPQGRRPFQQGGIEERIAAAGALASLLEEEPALTATGALVRAFHTELVAARDAQQRTEAGVDVLSTNVEQQRKAAALVLQKNLARLMEKYAETPELILTFFDLRDVRSRPRRRPAV